MRSSRLRAGSPPRIKAHINERPQYKTSYRWRITAPRRTGDLSLRSPGRQSRLRPYSFEDQQPEGRCKFLTQQRDFETDELVWVPALAEEMVDEAEADAYIQRAISRDPDLWVIEIEDKEMDNPFQDIC